MRILFIAPLPPPITGQSLVSKAIYDYLNAAHQVDIIDLRKESFEEGFNSFNRVTDVLKIVFQVFKKSRDAEVIYLTISESFAGNIKDLFIYLACANKLSKTYIHLHGGTIKTGLWDCYPILYSINKLFLKKLGGVIVSGNSHIKIFNEVVSSSKIHIINNFVPPAILIKKSSVIEKFKHMEPINILYVGHMIEKKGYDELLKGFQLLDHQVKNKVKIDYAGAFSSDQLKAKFLLSIADIENITYHGLVSEEKKKTLFKRAHIFCIPTTYFEGQPITILEAYATGCVVIATGKPGILDIFDHTVNGYEISGNLSKSICAIITQLVSSPANLKIIGLLNYSIAQKGFNLETYNSSIEELLLNKE